MILVKTEAGLQVLKDRSVRLTPRQRSVFIMFDGKRSAAEVLQVSQGQADDVEALIELGLLKEGESPSAATAPLAASERPARDATTVDAPTSGEPRTAQQRYQAGYPIASQLTASLGLRGFRLNLAVEAATSCEELERLIPKIRAAVGPEKSAVLERVMGL